MTLYYCQLEPYTARYTLQLTEWNKRVFDHRGMDVVYVSGDTLDNSQQIVVGQVLDAHGRSYYSMSQMMNLVSLMQQGKITNKDVIYFEDMFTPGFESLGYIIDQIPSELCPRIFVRCLAQSIDPDDFVNSTGMSTWMGQYEQMVNTIVAKSGGAILASNEEMVANIKIAGWTAPVYNISGLAFNKEEVLERVDNQVNSFFSRPNRIAFSARWDAEKQPHFFMDLIEEFLGNRRNKTAYEFTLLSGGSLKSNDQTALARARDLQSKGLLVIHENLAKNEYYNFLNNSKVVFNCALQDWTSNTVSEADTLGCNVLFPAYRSFPEIFANDHTRLYVPWSLEDALNKLELLLIKPSENIGKISDWTDGTVDRICDIIEGTGEQWNRSSGIYREYTREAKYI